MPEEITKVEQPTFAEDLLTGFSREYLFHRYEYQSEEKHAATCGEKKFQQVHVHYFLVVSFFFTESLSTSKTGPDLDEYMRTSSSMTMDLEEDIRSFFSESRRCLMLSCLLR